jgi:long-chain fatty acid transport protein
MDELMILNRRKTLRLLAVMILVVSPLKVSANGFGLPDQDAFATARGEAFVATADNPSAIYYNPAGITQLEGNNLRGGIYAIYLDPSYTPPNSGHTFYSSDNFAAAPQIFYTYTLKNLPLSFGLGLYAPFGGSINWPQDTGFRTVAIDGSLTYLRINPVVAYKILPSLSIGAGLTVNYANIDLEQGLRPFSMPLINYFRFTGDGWSAGYNLGLLWQPYKKISIGASFRSSTTFTMEGQTKFEQQPIIATGSRSAHADFTFPLTAVFGISYRPTPKWNLEFDADYTDWSSFGTISLHQTSPPPPLKSDVSLILNWQASWMYEFGATRYFEDGWHVSAGYLFNENSVPNAYYTPLATDLDRHFFSIGAGRTGKRFDFDISYQFGYGSAHTVTGSTPSSTPGQFAGQTADGTYNFISHAVLVTVGIHF